MTTRTYLLWDVTRCYGVCDEDLHYLAPCNHCARRHFQNDIGPRTAFFSEAPRQFDGGCDQFIDMEMSDD